MLISLAVVILCKVLKHMQYYICLYCIGFSAHGFSCYSSSFKVGWKWKCAIYREARQKDVRPKKNSLFYFLINFAEIFYLLFLYFCFCLFVFWNQNYVFWYTLFSALRLADIAIKEAQVLLNIVYPSCHWPWTCSSTALEKACVINWFGVVRNISQVIFWTFQRDTKEQKQKKNDVEWWRCSHFSMIRDFLFQFKC